MNRVKLTDIKSEGNVRQGNKNKEKTYVSMKNSIETRGGFSRHPILNNLGSRQKPKVHSILLR